MRIYLLASMLLSSQYMVFWARDQSPVVEVDGGTLHWPLSSSQALRVGPCISRGQGGGSGVSPFSSPHLPSPGPAVGQYASPLAKRCCQDGLTRLPMTRSCEQRMARVQQLDCREPFLSCCKFAEGLRKKAWARGQVGLARGEGWGGVGGQAGAPEETEWPPHSFARWSPSPGDPAGGGPDG